MEAKAAVNARREIAVRNLDSILDAAERLIGRGEGLNFSALAAEAGVSRPTVYAHFPDRRRLLVALVQRAAREAVAAVDSAGPDLGPPVEALRRVVHASWEHLARHRDVARIAASELTAESIHEAHHGGHHDAVAALARLIERGRSEGAFRDDLPVVWLVHGSLALMHAATAAARSGQLSPDSARGALVTSVEELCVGASSGRRG